MFNEMEIVIHDGGILYDEKGKEEDGFPVRAWYYEGERPIDSGLHFIISKGGENAASFSLSLGNMLHLLTFLVLAEKF